MSKKNRRIQDLIHSIEGRIKGQDIPYIEKQIDENKDSIDEFIKEFKSEGRKEAAKHYEKMIKRYEKPAASFKISKKDSFSFDTGHMPGHHTAKIVGFAIAVLLAGFTIYSGYKLAQNAEVLFNYIAGNYNQKIESIGNPIKNKK